jgi:FAD/FMN-containing dehydrogenase
MLELKNVIKGEVDASDATRAAYNHDASIFEVTPEVVVFPRDDHDLQSLVRYAIAQKSDGVDVSLTPRVGGTCMSGGPLSESIVVDLQRHYNHIGEVDVHGRNVWVQSGAMHINLEKKIYPKHLFFAPYTSSRDICGIGGMIGNNASGERSVKFGPTSSNVGKLRVLLSDGEIYEFGPMTAKQVERKKQLPTFEGHIYRELTQLVEDNWHLIEQSHPQVKKNAAGYALWDLWDAQRAHFNLARLFVGAQGTLGFVTEAELKLTPFTKAERMIVVPIQDLSQLTPAVKGLLRYSPAVCETFDHFTYELAKQHHPEDAARASVADGKHMVVFAIYSGDNQQQADEIAGLAKESLERAGQEVSWVDDRDTVESMLLIRRKSFRMLLENPHDDSRALAFLEDTIVPIDNYGEFLAALESIIAEYDMTYTYAGHIGDGSIRLVPLANVEAEGAAERIMELERRVIDLVLAFGGSMSVDHNDGIIRTPFIERMYGEQMYNLFTRVKEIFDPMGIFNPGKKVGGSLEFATAHIVKHNN